MDNMYYIVENDMTIFFHNEEAMKRYQETGDRSTIIWEQPLDIQKYKDSLLI